MNKTKSTIHNSNTTLLISILLLKFIKFLLSLELSGIVHTGVEVCQMDSELCGLVE